jgi:hypothetical protein
MNKDHKRIFVVRNSGISEESAENEHQMMQPKIIKSKFIKLNILEIARGAKSSKQKSRKNKFEPSVFSKPKKSQSNKVIIFRSA